MSLSPHRRTTNLGGTGNTSSSNVDIPADFLNNHIQDYGKDGGGIIRHIARDIQIPPVISHGNYKPYHWYELCKILYLEDDPTAPPLKV
jgi:hypothetical protein